MIISFGWTSPALVAHACYTPHADPIKTRTRREWDPKHALRFNAGDVVDAWNTSPRNVHGNPHRIARIQLNEQPFQETEWPPPEDWQREGFDWLAEHNVRLQGHEPIALWRSWHMPHESLWVVSFTVLEVFDVAPALALMTPTECARPYALTGWVGPQRNTVLA